MKYGRCGLLAVGLAAGLMAAPVALLAADDYVSPKLVRFHYTDRTQVKALADAGLDIAGHGPGWVDVVMAGDADLESHLVTRTFGRLGRVEVVEENLDSLLDPFRDRADLGRYHTYDEAMAELDAFAADFPNLARVVTLGTSFEKRPIRALKISDNVAADEGEPGFLIAGLHHSREWITVEVPLALAETLLKGYGSDERLTRLVNEREIWIVPVVNPDGLTYSQTSSRMWRKNRRKNSDGTYGVDPNRNYEYQWGGAGASTSPGSDTYRGPSAASELCVQTMQNFARTHKNLKGAISFHSYGELILWPWSYTYDPAPDDGVLGRLSREMAKLNKYQPKQSSDLYPSSGDTDDFMYGVCGLASFTFELANSFIPAESQVDGICRANVASLLWFIENGTDPFPILRHEAPGATTNAQGPHVLDVTFNASHGATFPLAGITATWSRDGGPAQEKALTSAGNDRWTVGLPGGATGSYAYHFTARATDGRTVRFPAEGEFSFKVVESLYLLVDDDGGRDYEGVYLAALESLGLPVAVHDRSAGAPTAAQLAGASAVVWSCGAESSNALDKDDQKLLTAYLKNGGRFLLFGQDVAYSLKNSDFLRDVLKTDYVDDNSGLRTLTAPAGSPLAGLSLAISSGDAVNQSYPEVIAPRQGAVACLTYQATRDDEGVESLQGEKVGAVAVDGASRIVFVGFGLEGVDGAQNRADLLGRSLSWATGSAAVNLRGSAALEAVAADETDAVSRRSLALQGAQAAEDLESSLVGLVDEGSYEQARSELDRAVEGSVEAALASWRPILRTLRRRLAAEEGDEAAALRSRVEDLLR